MIDSKFIFAGVRSVRRSEKYQSFDAQAVEEEIFKVQEIENTRKTTRRQVRNFNTYLLSTRDVSGRNGPRKTQLVEFVGANPELGCELCREREHIRHLEFEFHNLESSLIA